jgi:lipase chaperone LimK
VSLFITKNDLFFAEDAIQGISFSQSKSDSILLETSQTDNLPNSLKLTQVDGQLEVDDEGNLIISAQIKNVFDYFLMTLGEENLDEILIRINAHLAKELQEPALSQAQSILAQYLDYKNNMVTLNESYSDEAGFLGGEFEMLQRQLDMQTRLRRETMEPDVVEAFFKFDEIYDQWSLERLKVGADDSLSFDERRQRLNQMEQDLPEEMRVLQEGKYQPQVFRQLQNTQTFSSEEEKYSFYQQEFGDDAAQRLKLLDSRRQQWQARLDDFFEQKGVILSVEGLDQADKESAIRELIDASFSDNEQRRLAALEHIAKMSVN